MVNYKGGGRESTSQSIAVDAGCGGQRDIRGCNYVLGKNMAPKSGRYLALLSFRLTGWVDDESPFEVYEARDVFGAIQRKLPAQETRSRRVTRDDER